MGRVKGGIIRARLEFLTDRLGADATKAVVASLPAEDQKSLAEGILVSRWYPFELLVRLDHSVAGSCGGEQALEELGARSAEFHLGALYRNFALSNAPHDFFRNASLSHQLFHDRGSMEYERTADNGCTLKVMGPDVDPIYCRSAIGYFRRSAQLCGGGSATVIKRSCRADGAPACVYEIRW